MNNLTSVLTSPVAVILYIILLSFLAIYITICIVKKNSSKRLKRHNTMELKKLVSDVGDVLSDSKTTVSSNNMRTIKRPKEVEEFSNTEVSTSSVDLLIQDEKVLTEVNQTTINNNVSNVQVIKENTVTLDNDTIETLNVADVSEEVLNNSITSNDDTLKTEIEEFYMNEPVVSNISVVKEVASDAFVSGESVTEVLDAVEETPKTEEVLQYTTIAPQEEEAKRELQKITEQLQREAMENSLIEHTEFEDEQEKNAIISMDELMSKADTLYVANEETQYKDEGNEPISLQDLEEQYKKQKEVIETIDVEEISPVEIENNVEEIEALNVAEDVQAKPLYEGLKQEKFVLDDFSSVKINKPDIKKIPYQETFKTSPVISPVFGITDKNTSVYSSKTELELENTANYEKLDEEIRKTNEFLATLKELQNKLD